MLALFPVVALPLLLKAVAVVAGAAVAGAVLPACKKGPSDTGGLAGDDDIVADDDTAVDDDLAGDDAIGNDDDDDDDITVDDDISDDDAIGNDDIEDDDAVGNDDDDDDEGRPTPTAPASTRFSNMDPRCDFPASLSFDAGLGSLLATCGTRDASSSHFFLFRSSDVDAPASSYADRTWDVAFEGEGYPSHHMPLNDTYYLVNHSGPDGFTIFDIESGAETDRVIFADVPSIQTLGFAVNNPAGAVLLGGTKLCVATSNLDYSTFEYGPGTVHCFDYDGAGGVDTDSATTVSTSGLNPTGMAVVRNETSDDGSIYFSVLNTNDYSPAVGATAILDTFEFPGFNLADTADMGPVTAQMSPSLTVSPDGLVLAGLQTRPARLVGIDHIEGTIAFNREIEHVENFISAIQYYNSLVAISDFGTFGETGRVVFVNTDIDGWDGEVVSTLYGTAGPSTMIGSALFQTITETHPTTGMPSASVWRMEMDRLE